AGWLGYAVVPWYLVEGGFAGYPAGAAGSALVLGFAGDRIWLLPLVLPLLAATVPLQGQRRRAIALVAAGIAGLAWLALEGFAIGHRGWSAEWLAALFGAPGPKQGGMGYGAFLTALAFVMLL